MTIRSTGALDSLGAGLRDFENRGKRELDWSECGLYKAYRHRLVHDDDYVAEHLPWLLVPKEKRSKPVPNAIDAQPPMSAAQSGVQPQRAPRAKGKPQATPGNGLPDFLE